MNLLNVLRDHWPLISTWGAVLAGAFWAGHTLGAQGKTTLQQTHASQIALLHERLDFAKEKKRTFGRK
jgi:hypothetical protein